jgi:2-hydroxy-3-oxopropionate reductase
MKEKVGFIGLGAMGVPMSQRLLEAGYPLVVFDVRKEAMETIVKKGAKAAASPKEVAEQCGKVITIVPNSDAVEQVVFGPAASWRDEGGDVLMEMTSSYRRVR